MEIAVRISASQFWGSNLVSLFLVLHVLALFSVCTPTTDTFLLSRLYILKVYLNPDDFIVCHHLTT